MSYTYGEDKTKEDIKDSEYAFQTVKRNGKPKTRGWSLASLVCAITSVILSMLGWPGIVLAVVAIIFAVIARITLGYFDGMLLAGIIIGIHGLFISIVSISLVNLIGDGRYSSFYSYIKEILNKANNGPI